MINMYGDNLITRNRIPSKNDTNPLPVDHSVFFNRSANVFLLTGSLS